MIYILVVIQAIKPVCTIKKQNPSLISSHKTKSNPKAGVMMNIRVGSKPSSPHPAENQATKPVPAPKNQATKPNPAQNNTYSSYTQPRKSLAWVFPGWREIYKLLCPFLWIYIILVILRLLG